MSAVITEAYRALNAQQHHDRQEWGLQSIKYWKAVKEVCDRNGFASLLDYGCGKRSLERALTPFGIKVTNYDPAFPELAASPEPHDFVVCTDVLEHVEPECLDAVIADLVRVTKQIGFFVVATRPSLKNLPDGTNPHRIVENRDWWLSKLAPFFNVTPIEDAASTKYFGVAVTPK